MAPTPFRFGVQAFDSPSAGAWRQTARKAESLGYSTLLLADHYLGPGPAMESANHPPQGIAAVPAMMAAADATSMLRVGARVLGLDYHQPVVLAKELMTIDLLSEGRLEVGLGAGWLGAEYEAMGVRFDAPGERIERLAQFVKLFKAYAAPGQLDPQAWSGTQIHGFEGVPKPTQLPRPPIMIGGGGKRVLQLAAREADIVSLNFNNASGVAADPRATGPSQMTEKVQWVREAAGDRLASIELDVGAYFVSVDKSAAAAEFVPVLGETTEAVREHPHALVGSVAGICEELERRRDLYGVSYITVFDHAMEPFAPIVAALAGR